MSALRKRRTPSHESLFFTRRRRRQLVILLLTLIIGAGGGLYLRGKVISVPDGDTVLVFAENGERRRIRLYGVDCPELQQQGGDEAKNAASALMLFEAVDIRLMDKDRYGREVAILTLKNGTVVNEELVRQGHAWVYDAYCKTSRCLGWRLLEKKARDAKSGLWKEEKPEPPWRWRRQHKSRSSKNYVGDD